MLSINYDNIIKSFINTTYIREKLVTFIMSIVSKIIIMCISSIICYVVQYNIFVNYFLHITISIFLSYIYQIVYNVIIQYKQFYDNIIIYFTANYTIDNYHKWKNMFITIICIYLIILLTYVYVTTSSLIIYITQFWLSHFIIDIIEHNKLLPVIDYIRDRQTSTLHESIVIHDNHFVKHNTNTIQKINIIDEYIQ